MTPLVAQIRGNLRSCVTLAAAAATGLFLATGPTAPPAAASTGICGSLTRPVLERVNPGNSAVSITLNSAQSSSDQRHGFTRTGTSAWLAASRGGPGLVAVHQMFRASHGGNYFYAKNRSEIAAAARAGYRDRGVAFYAATRSSSCVTAVRSYYRGGVHRFTSSSILGARLQAQGWRREPVRFYLGVDSAFSIAVLPDTQQEVLRSDDGRFANRTSWLAQNRRQLDLRFVTHVGDVVNWDTPDHAQYQVARAGLAPLEAAKIPYSLCIGNHDTQATGVGGSARDPSRTHALQRDTHVFNAYFNHQGLDLAGAYERGKVDNTYHTFAAGGAQWLVLNLELWPRSAVVAWAAKVVASHPDDNVIVVTHSYLTGSGAIFDSNGGYGDTAPTYLDAQVIRKYPNVRLVFSGHAGLEGHRVERGVHGNRIDDYLLTMHSNTTNPVRLVTIDTLAGSMHTWVYAPWTHQTYAAYDSKVSTLNWVR